MKSFACGDIIPGCTETFAAADEEEIFAQAAPHAASVHGITEDMLTPELLTKFRAAIVSV